jgi:hypothetical protein
MRICNRRLACAIGAPSVMGAARDAAQLDDLDERRPNGDAGHELVEPSMRVAHRLDQYETSALPQRSRRGRNAVALDDLSGRCPDEVCFKGAADSAVRRSSDQSMSAKAATAALRRPLRPFPAETAVLESGRHAASPLSATMVMNSYSPRFRPAFPTPHCRVKRRRTSARRPNTKPCIH